MGNVIIVECFLLLSSLLNVKNCIFLSKGLQGKQVRAWIMTRGPAHDPQGKWENY